MNMNPNVIDNIPLEKFGKDHWSTFAYIESITEEKKDIDQRCMRSNPDRHPQFTSNTISGKWNPDHGTRLAGYFTEKTPRGRDNLRLSEHDDWDCLNDLETAGLLVNVGTGIHPRYTFTADGHAVANQLREFKRRGGNFSDFRPASAQTIKA